MLEKARRWGAPRRGSSPQHGVHSLSFWGPKPSFLGLLGSSLQSPHSRQDGAGPSGDPGSRRGSPAPAALCSQATAARASLDEASVHRPAHGLQLRSGAAQRSPGPPGLHQGKNTPAGRHPLCTNKSARPRDSGLCLSWHLCPREPAAHPGRSPPQRAAAVGRLPGRLRTRGGRARAATAWVRVRAQLPCPSLPSRLFLRRLP